MIRNYFKNLLSKNDEKAIFMNEFKEILDQLAFFLIHNINEKDLFE
jgi:hypothetical protein